MKVFTDIKIENFIFYMDLKIEKHTPHLHHSNTHKKTTKKKIYLRKNQISSSCFIVSTTSKTSD